jgi:hypothetical protein
VNYLSDKFNLLLFEINKKIFLKIGGKLLYKNWIDCFLTFCQNFNMDFYGEQDKSPLDKSPLTKSPPIMK